MFFDECLNVLSHSIAGYNNHPVFKFGFEGNDFLVQRHPAGTGHSQIHKNDVIRIMLYQINGLLSVAGKINVLSLIGERLPQQSLD